MPRSIEFSTRCRLILLALVLIAPLFISGGRVDAQRRRPARSGNPQLASSSPQLQKKNLTRVSSSDTVDGSSITVFSDLPLNDYSAYRGGDRFYVLIPGADASRLVTGLRGRGFVDVRVQKRGNDVLLSFRLLAGSAARVSQKFNRLEILVTVPALVAANTTKPADTGSGVTQVETTGPTRNASGANSSRGTQRGSGTSVRYGGSSNSSGATQEYSTGGRNPISSSPEFTSTPEGIPVNPDGQVIQQGTTDLSPNTQASPIVTPPTTPPSDQIAQTQPTSGVPVTIEQAPTTTTVAPAAGTSLSAQVKQNWLFILLAIAIAGLVAWVLFARSRADDHLVESRIEAIRQSRVDAVRASKEKVKPIPTPSKIEVAPLVESAPVVVEPEPLESEVLVAPELAAIDVADTVVEDSAQEEIQEKVIEPVKPVAVEQATEDVASLLAGKPYDEAGIGTQDSAARQMVAAELLAALSGRNIGRHELARNAFIKHGYFDDATRTLRTADSPGERASAARSLGLIRDDSGTPHLVAALEDSSPEVRRAAVESLAEVRDAVAVAPLEALRDREKSRRVPKALIQHAIEASVIGRAKLETPAPQEIVTPSEPLESDAAAPLLFESDEPALEVNDHLSSVQAEDDMVLEMPTPHSEAEAAQATEPELVVVEHEDSQYSTTPVDVAEDVLAPVVMAEPLLEHIDTTDHVEAVEAVEQVEQVTNEWVDIDVSRSSKSRRTARKTKTAPVDKDEPASLQLEDTSDHSVLPEVEQEMAQPGWQDVPESGEVTSLPFGVTDAVIAESDLTGAVPPVLEDVGELQHTGDMDQVFEVSEADYPVMRAQILGRLASENAAERAAAVESLGRVGGEDSFHEITAMFDDPSPDVRDATARALFRFNPDRAGSFTRALREASPERRRHIGAALSSSGLATEAIGDLMGEGREKTYDAFSLLFLMSKAGEVQPLMHAVEEHPNNEVRLAVVKLLALSGQQEILPAFRRLAVRGSLPTEVRSAVMEAIYQLSSQS